ncbi:MAG: hypothetical protein DMD80_13920 [Candidatus Rokuibacteriota bacterium]|nr:MAG: hypothetical protein DMD80_13920 [Candidatus Rokubacteria bacterium]
MPVLAKLEKEYADLGRRIAVHKNTIAEYEASMGKRPRKPAVDATEANGKTPRGRVVEHIDTILSVDRGLTEPDVRAQIKDRLDATYSRASVYSALIRGLKANKYEMHPDKTWWKKKTEGVRLVS